MTFSIPESLTKILSLLSEGNLGEALAQTENYLLAYPRPHDSEVLAAIKDDARRLYSYWLDGYDDPSRARLHQQLIGRLYALATDMAVRQRLLSSTYFSSLYQNPRRARGSWSLSVLRQEMEEYVASMGLLSLEEEHVRSEKARQLQEQHQQLMALFFDYIVTSRSWGEGTSATLEDMFLSPTVDQSDQALLMSAVTLAGMEHFCFQKFRLLLAVYHKSSDEAVRQRALVGWSLMLCGAPKGVYPEIETMVAGVTADDRAMEELTELQMQLVYCLQTESDNSIIRDEIMPTLIKHSNIRLNDQGKMEETEDDPLEDILHPEKSEQDMEMLEQTMHRMMDMQKQGSDIFYAGFSQMKRFPFFHTVSNWFAPFSPDHAQMLPVFESAGGRAAFLKRMLASMTLCDSDKYSFALAFQQVLNRLPENMLRMMDQGELVPLGGEISEEQRLRPAFIRRQYLQNLYRFYRLYPVRQEFSDPFRPSLEGLFFFHRLSSAPEKKSIEIASFLGKKGHWAAVETLLAAYPDSQEWRLFMLRGRAAAQSPADDAGRQAVAFYEKALQLSPGNEKAEATLARACYAASDHQAAAAHFLHLMEEHPDTGTYALSAAVCLTLTGRFAEALPLLHRLYYEQPDNADVLRTLAWAQTGSHNYEQALALYRRLLASGKSQPDDTLNHGCCLWCSGRRREALAQFTLYASENPAFDFRRHFAVTERSLLLSAGITDTDIQLMADSALTDAPGSTPSPAEEP